MIQTQIKNDNNEIVTLEPSDPRYWNGPYRYVPYPKLLFRASVGRYQDGDLEAREVKTDAEHRALPSDWKESPDEARAQFDAVELEISKAAAESAHSDRNMSAKAQIERLAAERATDEHLIDVPAPKRRGPKTKLEKAALAAQES